MTELSSPMKRILLNVEATSACYADCSMCPRHVIGKHGRMSRETLEATLATATPDFVHEISFAGRGEPALHPNIADYLGMARTTGIFTSIVTTATNLNEKRAESVLDNVDVLRLSVSSIEPEIFKLVHRGLKFDGVKRNIENLAAMCPEKITAHLTGGPVIYDTVPQTVEWLRGVGIQRILLFPLWNRGGDIEAQRDNQRRSKLLQDLSLITSESEYGGGSNNTSFQRDWRDGLAINDSYCAVGDSSISVNYDGRIVGCFQDFGQSSVIGDVFNTPLLALWRERKTILGKMPICQGCAVNHVSFLEVSHG